MSGLLHRFTSSTRLLFGIPRDNPELVQAKLTAFGRQVPMMYALVMVNTLALAITHYATAPLLLTVYLPAALDAICMIRLIMWWHARDQQVSLARAIARLRATVVLAAVLGVAFSAWSLSLFPYGDAYAQGHVAFFMAVTVIGCGFCLMHLRVAALLAMGLVAVPFAAFFGTSGNAVFVSIAMNFVMVVAAVMVMIMINYRDFERRVNSEKALLAKQVELQSMSDTNLRNSNIDMLTGLPNRRHFFSELEQRIALAATSGTNLILGILDLDGFKPINDVYGHRIGDRLLAEVGARLRANLAPHVFVGRLGGDEFVICSDRLDTQERVDRAADALADLFNAPFEIDDITIRIGCSIGHAEFPRVAKTAEDLYERADYALFFAKRHDRGATVAFSAEHEATIRHAGAIDQALSNADLDDELWIAYQPIVDAVTSRPVSFEALARWKSPVLGDVPPMTFIVAAERSGLIGQLTPILLRKALEGAATWPENIRISFNLSAVDIASPLSILNIVRVVTQSGIAAGRIDFEITETAVMRNMAKACEALGVLKELGARISLDDFGTGYSSLSCMRELPLDKVKLDRSFLRHVDTDAAAQLILKTMIGLCASLKLDCVVEGVETARHMTFLRDQGCRLMQGYFFAKPMSASRVVDYLAACETAAFQAAIGQG
jgi:diguanylate cyclase (GGDEF)-like protein